MSHLGPEVERPGYDREGQFAGIVHFGIGAFHRAHQAWYTDLAMELGDRNWAITGVSLLSAAVAAQLNPQDGLYTLTERSSAGNHTRLIAAVKTVLVASDAPHSVVSALASPNTHIASFTVTEKGYCRAVDGSLDLALAGPGSIYHFLAEGLRQRHDAGLSGLTLLSCDNLTDNGGQFARLMREYLDRQDSRLGKWFEAECSCPSTMVDRIVPATTDADRMQVAAETGLDDFGAVMTEPFSQWVIEDRFAGPRPAWERVGAQLVTDVAPYETAKLRMLNGAHSALAYLGLERGHTYVHEAVADPTLRAIIDRLMREEAAASFVAAPQQNLTVYADELLARFANPALDHRLIQIAMDGSQKVPQRWLATLAGRQAAGARCPAILSALAAWLRHLRGDNAAKWGPVDDPRANELRQLWVKNDSAGVVDAMFGQLGLLGGPWIAAKADRAMICAELSHFPSTKAEPDVLA